MSFASTLAEARERFGEALQLINQLESAETERTDPVSNTHKALKGLVLVLIYAAVERAVNSAVDQAIYEISSHASPSFSCAPAVLSIFHFTKIQALKACGHDKTFPKAIELLASALSHDPVSTTNNPLTPMLQNVDAKTMISVTTLLGINGYSIPGASTGRLNNLRERRNAVSHGRESASFAGERFTIVELRRIYTCADTEINRFVEALKIHCVSRRYLVGAA